MGQDPTSFCLFLPLIIPPYHPPPTPLQALSFLLCEILVGQCTPVLLTTITTALPSLLPSQTALPHQFCAGSERSQEEERGERREDLVNRGERDHGCSLCLAEDLGNPTGPVPGSGTSGEWTGGKLRPALFWSSLGIKAPGKGWWGSGCL